VTSEALILAMMLSASPLIVAAVGSVQRSARYRGARPWKHLRAAGSADRTSSRFFLPGLGIWSLSPSSPGMGIYLSFVVTNVRAHIQAIVK